MDNVFLPPLSRVAICGSTHGNELSGVHIVREMLKEKVGLAAPASLTTVISNPRAMDVCRRYIDKDLNRCFTNALLSAPTTDSTAYELRRAQELNDQLGPKGSQQAVDLLLDLHNTTANMDVCLILTSSDWVSLHIFKYIQSKMTSAPVRAIMIDETICEPSYLSSVGKHGFALEIGPQPHGVVRADIFNLMKEAVDLTLEWLQAYNSGSTFEGGEVEGYACVKTMDYPRDPTTNEITAAIHPQLQDNDFKLLQPGDPIFLRLTGESVRYDGEELYPYFINECAYYEKNIAFYLGKKITLSLPSIKVNEKEIL